MQSLTILFGIALAVGGQAQQPIATPKLDSTARNETIAALTRHVRQGYVLPDVGEKMAQMLNERTAKGEYNNVDDAKALAEKLTQDLRSVCHDKHLGIRYSANLLPPDPPKGQEPTRDEREQMRRFGNAINWGFERVERLLGNIGYLNLRGFAPPEEAGETAAAAMNFVAGTDALIIDLRQNGGGEPGMVALLCSYLFDASGEGIHLNDIYTRADNSTRQYWTLPHVEGKRYGKTRPVYLLTSQRTFSAAEEFCYNLKTLKRVVIVGETTGGGANPGDDIRLTDHFAMFLPTGRAINPITKTNWEGTGVAPDIAVPEAQALDAARLAILRQLADSEPDSNRKVMLKHDAEELERSLLHAEKPIP